MFYLSNSNFNHEVIGDVFTEYHCYFKFNFIVFTTKYHLCFKLNFIHFFKILLNLLKIYLLILLTYVMH